LLNISHGMNPETNSVVKFKSFAAHPTGSKLAIVDSTWSFPIL
jgi:hypothetical protein